MYIPIICIAYFFDYKIGILSGVIAELLIDIFASQNLTLANSERLFVSFFRTILFCSTGRQ
jgi:glucose-6-phosphate-specific signal transduction histidine kinase